MFFGKFQRQVENFVCEHCGHKVKGNGYTNHCPKCLWSKHVDINPGDRAEVCKGLMKPVDLEGGSDKQVIVHHCVKCGFERKNKVVKDDDLDAVIALSNIDLS